MWDQRSVEERIARAQNKSHIKKMDFDMEPTFTNKAFDFYGAYVRINEPQKYKYAETQLTFFY